MKKLLIVIMLLVGLSGCATTPPTYQGDDPLVFRPKHAQFPQP